MISSGSKNKLNVKPTEYAFFPLIPNQICRQIFQTFYGLPDFLDLMSV